MTQHIHDRIAAIREALELVFTKRGRIQDHEMMPFYEALAHLDALEKEREELREAVRDFDAVGCSHEIIEVMHKHAATIAGCKQQGDGDE